MRTQAKRRGTSCGRAGLAVLTAWLVLAAAAVAAQPEPAARQQARALYQAGKQAFEAGRLEEALARFRQAYALEPAPAMLLNICNAAQLIGLTQQALDACRQYLRLVPDAPDLPVVERRIQTLQASLRPEPPPPAEPEPAPPAAAPSKPAPQPQTPALTEQPSAPATPEPASASGAETSKARLWTWVAAGGAGVFGALGTVFMLKGNADWNSLESRVDELCARSCTQSQIRHEISASSVQTSDNLARLFVGLTAISAASAVTLYFLEQPEREQAAPAGEPRLQLGLSPGGLAIRGRF